MLLNDIDDNEVTNDSVISNQSRVVKIVFHQIDNSETTAGVLPISDRTIVTSQSLQYNFYWTKMRPEINNR